jgi:hypothetical protein
VVARGFLMGELYTYTIKTVGTIYPAKILSEIKG